MEPRISVDRPQLAIVAALGFGQMLSFASSFYLLGVLGEGAAHDLHARPALISSLLSVALLASALSAPAIGRWIDARGGKVVLMSASLTFATGLILIALSPSVPVLAAGVLVLGVGMALGLYETPFAILVSLYGQEARRPMAGVAMLGGLGSTLGWPTTLFLEHVLGWRGACLIWATVHLLVCLPLTLLVVPHVGARRRAEDGPRPAIRWDRPMAQMAALFAGAWMISAYISAHLPRLLQGFGLTPAAAVGAASLLGVAAVSMRLAEYTVLRKLPPVLTTRLATLLHPLGAASLLTLGGVAAPAFALAQGGGNGMLTVAKGALPLSLYGPENYAYRSALLATPARFAQVAGPVAFGLILDRSASLAVIVSAAVCLCMFAMTFGLSRPAREGREPPLPGPAPGPPRPLETRHSYAVYSGAQTLKAHKSSRRLP
jgi:predicted MFS family arabinose efflux permease